MSWMFHACSQLRRRAAICARSEARAGDCLCWPIEVEQLHNRATRSAKLQLVLASFVVITLLQSKVPNAQVQRARATASDAPTNSCCARSAATAPSVASLEERVA